MDLKTTACLSALQQITSKNQLSIYLRLDDGNGLKMISSHNTTLLALLQLIKSSSLILPTSFKLVHGGRELNNMTSTLKDLEITNNAIIHIENTMPPSARQIKMDVCVYFRGEKIIVGTKSQETVGELKQKLSRILKIAPRYQIIVFRGIQLDNGFTLEDYHIKANSLLCLTSAAQYKENIESTQNTAISDSPGMSKLTVSVGLKNRKSSKEMFRSEVYEDRPAYEIEIQEKPLNEQFKEFSFESLCPQIVALALAKPFSNDDSSSPIQFQSNSIHSGQESPTSMNLFRKDPKRTSFIMN